MNKTYIFSDLVKLKYKSKLLLYFKETTLDKQEFILVQFYFSAVKVTLLFFSLIIAVTLMDNIFIFTIIVNILRRQRG